MKKRRVFTLLFILSVVFLDICVNKAYAIDEEKYTNYTAVNEVNCGGLATLPSILPKIVSIIYILIQIAVPVVLVIVGTMDLVKGVTAQKEDDIKKAQDLFVKRLISAALVFFVITAVKLVISVAANKSDKSEGLISCMNCIIRDQCSARKAELEERSSNYKKWNCTLNGIVFDVTNTGEGFAENLRGYSKVTSIDNSANWKPSEVGECPSSDKYVAKMYQYNGEKIFELMAKE